MKTVQAECKVFLTILGFLLFLSSQTCLAGTFSDPELKIVLPDHVITFKRSELLDRSDLKTLEVNQDPAYPGKKMRYTVVSAYSLFKDTKIPEDATLQFQCLDGFSAPIDRARLLNRSTSRSIAYIAIEKKGEPWPAIQPPAQPNSAGPFYLVWENPQLSKISREEWPFQLAGFEVKPSFNVTFPNLVPDSRLKENHSAYHGFELFKKNCFPCHTLNLEGQARLGPDLNIPMNPTEYFSEKNLKKLIRDPQNLRNWPESKMKGFPESDLNDQEVDQIITYLKHMAKRKVNKKPSAPTPK